MRTPIGHAAPVFLAVFATLTILSVSGCSPPSGSSSNNSGAENPETAPGNAGQSEYQPPDRVVITPAESHESWDATFLASLGEKFTLGEGEVAEIGDTGLQLRISQFFNDPCGGEGINCFWSGVGIAIDYRFNEDIQSGINLVNAFGFPVTIIETDHETFATFIVEQSESER